MGNYYALYKHFKGKTMTEVKLIVRDANEFNLAYGKETVKWFNDWFGDVGHTSFKQVEGRGWHWVSTCNDEKVDEWVYDSLEKLIVIEGIEQKELEPIDKQVSFYGKAKILYWTDGEKSQELGLRSYDELVAIFHVGEGIEFTGWYSPTTTKHLKSYLFRPHFEYYGDKKDIEKKDMQKGYRFFFKSFFEKNANKM